LENVTGLDDSPESTILARTGRCFDATSLPDCERGRPQILAELGQNRPRQFETKARVMAQEERVVFRNAPQEFVDRSSVNSVNKWLAETPAHGATFTDTDHLLEERYLCYPRFSLSRLLFQIKRGDLHGLSEGLAPQLKLGAIGGEHTYVLDRNGDGWSLVRGEIRHRIGRYHNIGALGVIGQICQQSSKYHEQHVDHLLTRASLPEPGETGPDQSDDFIIVAFHWLCFVLLPIFTLVAFVSGAKSNNMLPVIVGWILMWSWLSWFAG
jgi:hypothetical protein